MGKHRIRFCWVRTIAFVLDCDGYHWKATTEYHKTKDIFHVKNFLGHKSVKNTEIYINIEHTLFEPSSDEFTVRVAEKPDEVKALLEVGFEWVGQKDSLIFLRKRK